VPIAQKIACMECGEAAYLAQPIGPEDEIRSGDVVTYLGGACAQRWDVVVEDEDVDDDIS